MQVEIDLSGRIEESTRPTVLALANGMATSIRITAAEKRKVMSTLRQGQGRWSASRTRILVFSVLLYLLLEEHVEKLDLIIIDPEYEGHEPLIKDRVMTLCRQQGISVYKDQITFQRVGKKSPAHDLAVKVFRGKASAGREVTAEEVLAEF